MELHNEELYAYLGGLIDADGHITIVHQPVKQNHAVQVCIYNCNTKIIDYLLKVIGGGHTRSNKINKTHSKWRNCTEYKLRDNRAIDLIEKVLPYLIVKRRQALVALKARDIKTRYNRGEKIHHPELKQKCDAVLARLKTQINKLNIRGSRKRFKSIDVSAIPFNINYLAGFCDADGSIMITKGSQYVIAKITFANTDKNVINWIQYYMGGNLWVRNFQQSKWNTGYQLSFSGESGYALAKALYPWLILKQRQAKLVMTLGKVKKLFKGSTLMNNPTLHKRHKELQIKLKTLCSKLNKRSA